jgi:kinesin family protein 15
MVRGLEGPSLPSPGAPIHSKTPPARMLAVAGEAVVDNCMAGFNSSIFAYGQTGAGKTYTMQGAVERGEDSQLSPQVC